MTDLLIELHQIIERHYENERSRERAIYTFTLSALVFALAFVLITR